MRHKDMIAYGLYCVALGSSIQVKNIFLIVIYLFCAGIMYSDIKESWDRRG